MSDRIDPGLSCLVLIARLHNVAADSAQLAHEFAVDGRSMGTQEVLLAARKLGLQAKHVRTQPDRLAKTPLPAMAVGKDENGATEFFILARANDDASGTQVLIQSPRVGRPETLTLEQLRARWTGELILFTSRAADARRQREPERAVSRT